MREPSIRPVCILVKQMDPSSAPVRAVTESALTASAVMPAAKASHLNLLQCQDIRLCTAYHYHTGKLTSEASILLNLIAQAVNACLVQSFDQPIPWKPDI